MIRNRYTFSRPLTESEASLLLLMIGWRKGSHISTSGISVTGCVAHPDDMADFLKERRLGRQDRLKAVMTHFSRT